MLKCTDFYGRKGEKEEDSQEELVITKRSRMKFVRELERIDIIEFTTFHVTWNIL
jgi:hypothetical protein